MKTATAVHVDAQLCLGLMGLGALLVMGVLAAGVRARMSSIFGGGGGVGI